MGAGGSTAASCSSLDLANNGGHYYRQNRYQQHTHKQGMQKLRKQRKVPLEPKSGQLKQSTSYFDLTTSHLLDHHHHDDVFTSVHHQSHQLSPSAGKWRPATHSNVRDHSGQTGEVYSLSNANIGAMRPIKVLPCKPAVSPVLHLKKTNAGVASRILHQRQQQKYNELKKFSDSLPSLNNLAHHPQISDKAGKQQADLSRLRSPTNKNHLVRGGGSNSPHCYIEQVPATHQSHLLHNFNNEKTTNHQLVSKNRDAFYHNHQHYQQKLPWQVANRIDSNHLKLLPTTTTSQLMKRATSLSSLHNSNHQAHQHHSHHHHHLHHHQQQQQQSKQVYDHLENNNMVNCSPTRTPYAFNNNNNNNNSNANKIISSKASHQINKPPGTRPESMNSNCLPLSAKCDLQKQPCNQRHSSHLRSSPSNHYVHHHQQQPQPQVQYNQPPAMVKKVLKYKQAANNGGGQPSKQNKYKSKQQQQQQQQQSQQVGCPVLPPLPRSQSLHELIQLRATENGQRMRTTGTLRGPLGGGSGEPTNKVNLVAELLETRRQQKQQASEEHDQATMLSQSSSTDDGIHDVSITGDNNSTGDSRNRSQSSVGSRQSGGRKQELATDHDRPSSAGKQRIFKKQQVASSKVDANRPKRYSQNGNNSVDRNNNHQRVQTLVDTPTLAENHQAHRSTLKRSLSHSALHQQQQQAECNYDRSSDGDESEDLNELARFLYQFKKLHADKAKNAASNKPNVSPQGDNISSSKPSSSSPTGQANLQQSPNSTTSSSSGFASSTCRSQSNSSSDGIDELRRDYRAKFELSERPTSTSISPTSANQVPSSSSSPSSKKLNSRKKYPAPARPDELKLATEEATPTGGKKTKCPISGKLKLSSSLLSIVDEYQSTLQSHDRSSPTLIPSSTNLASVLMASGNGCASPVEPKSESNTNNIQLSRAHNDDGQGLHNQQQHQQLEQLKRYTQLRQLSQSELALNHLTAPTGLDQVGFGHQLPSSTSSPSAAEVAPTSQLSKTQANSRQQSSAGRPKAYKSRFINLIRRISDKSEVASSGHGRDLSIHSPTSGSKSLATCAVGGHQQQQQQQQDRQLHSGKGCQLAAPGEVRAINQKVAYSNQQQASRGQRFAPDSGKHSQAMNGAARLGCFSESLCDLNFDCDLELIKNCGSASREQHSSPGATAEACALTRPTASSSLTATNRATNGFCNPTSAADPKRRSDGQKELRDGHQVAPSTKWQQKQHQHQVASENNWQLGPSATSLLIANPSSGCLTPTANVTGCPSSCGESRTEIHHRNGNIANHQHGNHKLNLMKAASQSGDLNGKIGPVNKSADCVGGANTKSTGDKLTPPAQPGKLRWSASAWFLNAGSGAKKSKLQKQQAPPLDGKKYLDRLMSNSRGTPSRPVSSLADTQAEHSQQQQQQQVATSQQDSCVLGNSEADQLLDELDQSLALVSNADRHSNNDGHFAPTTTTTTWWQAADSSAQDNIRLGALLSDSDEESDDADYASINQAMINETFDVNLAKDNDEQPGSPSDSFTFSAPNSRSTSPRALYDSVDGRPNEASEAPRVANVNSSTFTKPSRYQNVDNLGDAMKSDIQCKVTGQLNDNFNLSNCSNQNETATVASETKQVTADMKTDDAEHRRLHLDHFHVDGKRIETGASCNKCSLANDCGLSQNQCHPSRGAKVNGSSTGGQAGDRFQRRDEQANSKHHPIQGQSTCCANCCGGGKDDLGQQQRQHHQVCDEKLTPSCASTRTQNGSRCNGRPKSGSTNNMEVDTSKFAPCQCSGVKRPQVAELGVCRHCRHCDEAKRETTSFECCKSSGDLDDNAACMECTDSQRIDKEDKNNTRSACNGFRCHAGPNTNSNTNKGSLEDNKLIIANGCHCASAAVNEPPTTTTTTRKEISTPSFAPGQATKTTATKTRAQVDLVTPPDDRPRVALKSHCKGSEPSAAPATAANSKGGPAAPNNKGKLASSVVTYYHYSHEMGKFALTNGQDVVMDKRPLRDTTTATGGSGAAAANVTDSQGNESRSAGNRLCPSMAVNNGNSSLGNHKANKDHDDDDDIHQISEFHLKTSNDNEIIGQLAVGCQMEFKDPKSCRHLRHPSSQLAGLENNKWRNEDVKGPSLGALKPPKSQSCVSGDNLLNENETTGRLDEPKLLTTRCCVATSNHNHNESAKTSNGPSGRIFCCSSSSPSNNLTDLCRQDDCYCCSGPQTKRQHQHNHYQHQQGLSDINCPSQSKEQLAMARKLVAAANQAKLKPICRSNSELTAPNGCNSGNNNTPLEERNLSAIRMHAGHLRAAKDGPLPLFGKLRSSLLNHKGHQQPPPSCPSKLLASSQLSLVNYYSKNSCGGVGGGPGRSHLASSNLMAPIKNNNNIDDNFILKRKTPNAGLKSQC